jgi:sugar phosphate isomerase/epimerase
MHPRISVNGVCFPKATLADDIAAWRALGAHTGGNHVRKLEEAGWDTAIDALRGSGVRMESFVHPADFRLDDAGGWDAFRAGFRRTLAAARELGARSIYSTSGCRGSLTWEDAADAFGAAMKPLDDEAKALGIKLLVEPTVPLHADKSIVHSLRDTLTLSERTGLGICLDMFHCWTEAGLKETILRAGPRIHLVQVGDYAFGDRAVPCRAVIGDGNIPIERILGWILESGYKGMFDLELNGPRIEREGNLVAVRRGVERLSEILLRLGA